jgi:UDP-N-acetylglucosamine enolpyruvyl transferase
MHIPVDRGFCFYPLDFCPSCGTQVIFHFYYKIRQSHISTCPALIADTDPAHERKRADYQQSNGPNRLGGQYKTSATDLRGSSANVVGDIFAELMTFTIKCIIYLYLLENEVVKK